MHACISKHGTTCKHAHAHWSPTWLPHKPGCRQANLAHLFHNLHPAVSFRRASHGTSSPQPFAMYALGMGLCVDSACSNTKAKIALNRCKALHAYTVAAWRSCLESLRPRVKVWITRCYYYSWVSGTERQLSIKLCVVMVLLNVFLVGRCGSSTSNASSSALLSSLRRGVASAAASQHEPACRYDTSSVCVHGSASEACALPSTSAAGVQLAEWRREAWASSRHVRRAPAGMYALFSGCSRRWTAQHVRELASHAHDHSGHSHLEQDCWSCQHRFRKGGLVCTGCEKIQPIDKSMNYFQLLGV